MKNFSFTDVMQVDADIEQVRKFVRDPVRIADYYPGIIEYGIFEQGRAIWCRADSGVSLLEYPPELCTDNRIVMQVTTSQDASPPYSVNGIKSRPFISMTEDWELREKDGGTQIRKTWHSLVQHKMKWLPMGFIIRRMARKESAILVREWAKAAKESGD